MKRWHRIVRVVSVVTVLAGLTWAILRRYEPFYLGKTLTGWLEQYSGQIIGGAFVYNQSESVREEAATAIRQIGTNAIPFLIKMAATQDSVAKGLVLRHYPVSNKLAAAILSQPIPFRWAFKSRFRPMNAFAGFKVLGRQATSAVPALIQVMRTSKNRDARYYALNSLACIGLNEKVLPALINNFREGDSDLRQTTINAILFDPASPPGTREFRPGCAQLIVPALTQVLADPKVDALRVIGVLSDLGPEAKAALPAIQPFLESPDPNVSSAAIKACKRIDPTGAIQNAANNGQ